METFKPKIVSYVLVLYICTKIKKYIALKNQKHLFSLQAGAHYFNCASKAPLLKATEAAAIEALQINRNPFLRTSKDFFSGINRVQTLFSQLINCRPSQVAIIPAVSYGIASVLNNVPCREGQHVIILEDEFPSDYLGVQQWCARHSAAMKVIKSNPDLAQKGADWNARILESITSDTALIVLPAVHWMTGLKFDWEAIGQRCKAMGATYVVDGTQVVGALPIDVQKCQIDALICGGYKWLMGPYSLSLAYLGDKFNDGKPIEESWMNRDNAEDFSALTNYSATYTPDAGRYNVGETSSFILMPMMEASLRQVLAWTPAAIQAYCKNLIQPLQTFLASIGIELEQAPYFANHIFGLKIPNVDTDLLQANLQQNRIYVSKRGNALRISVYVYNTEEDIKALIDTIKSTLN